MDLSELTAYAGEKYNMQEQHKWAEFPGFSVLSEPSTGKWIALLMRQWDYELGEELQRCDLKCGREARRGLVAPYLSAPYRMKGSKWVGVRFDKNTQPEVVFRLFDAAVRAEREESSSFTIVLEDGREHREQAYRDTAIPGKVRNLSRDVSRDVSREAETDVPKPSILDRFVTAIQSHFPGRVEMRESSQERLPVIPPKIHEMIRLFEYGDSSLAWKSRIFVRQARLMESYEDEAVWEGELRLRFPVYHDLSIRQLRGYFTWRAHARKGRYERTCSAFATIYVYELLCGIGVRSPEETLEKLQEFEAQYLDAGHGDLLMRGDLRRWMLDYAVVHGAAPEKARVLADPGVVQRDEALAVLRAPDAHTDGEVFAALTRFAGDKLAQSLLVSRDRAQGERLFAAVWRAGNNADSDLFTLCFGTQMVSSWKPLADAVYWEEGSHKDCVYALNECRQYLCRDGQWTMKRYEPLQFDKQRFFALWHESDRQLRRFFKTGHYLREKPEEAWAAPYAARVLEAEQRKRDEAERARAEEERAKAESARPKITIDLARLEQIRSDALTTRDSLLTEAELDALPEGDAAVEQRTDDRAMQERTAAGKELPGKECCFPGLDALHSRIIGCLLEGEDPAPLIREQLLMPSLAADTINEALLDEIGDNVVECDGSRLTLVEDYREELQALIVNELCE